PGSGPATARHVRGFALLGPIHDGGPTPTHADPAVPQELGARRAQRRGVARTDPYHPPARDRAFLRHVGRRPRRSRVGIMHPLLLNGGTGREERGGGGGWSAWFRSPKLWTGLWTEAETKTASRR